MTPTDVARLFAQTHPGASPERLAKIGRPAVWRGVTSRNGATCIAFSLDTERGIERFVLDVQSARDLSEGLASYLATAQPGGPLCQSPMSDGNPSVAVSTPDDEVKV